MTNQTTKQTCSCCGQEFNAYSATLADSFFGRPIVWTQSECDKCSLANLREAAGEGDTMAIEHFENN